MGGGDNTVVAAPSARNVNVDDKTSEEANTSNGAPAPSETNQEVQQDSSSSSSTTGGSSESSNGEAGNKADAAAGAAAGDSANDGTQTQAPTDTSSQGAKNDSSTEADQSPAKANVQVAATALGGRDFEGQVTKEINGKTYILIGNEQQLRAIGSGKKVIGRINKVTQTCTGQGLFGYHWVDGASSTEYAGDADLADSDTLRNADASDYDNSLAICHTKVDADKTRTRYYGVGADGTQADYSAANTGLTYSADANYLIFRDIDLSKNAADTASTEWTPLMFSGTMLGAVSNSADAVASLWKAVGADGASVEHTTAARPVISHVVVNQQGKQLDVSKQQGIGFFASITNKTVMNNTSLGSAGTAVVSNLKLQDVSVTNQASKSYIPPTLLGTLTSAVGGLLDLLLKALKLLTFGQVNLDLNLQGLLTLHKDNPSNLATGAFAGRIYGDAKVTDCEVADVSVSSVSRMTDKLIDYVKDTAPGGIRTSAETLVRSETAHFMNQGQKMAYEEIGIKQYRFVAALSELTCDRCGSLDGSVFDTDKAVEGENFPPIHPRCRCVTIMADVNLTSRIARDPLTGENYKVDGSMTFDEWKNSLSD